MVIIVDEQSISNYKKFILEYERKLFYGYDGPEDGFHKWLDTKQQEFKGSNKQGSVSLEDRRKVSKRTGNSALLSIKERNNLLQDETMYIPCKGTKGYFLNKREWCAFKDWSTLCKTNQIKIRLSQYMSNNF